MKLFISERQLSLSSSEKKAFAETYLALKRDKNIDPEHEAIVLQSLFLPSNDGIVKDDSSVDLSIASIISRALEKR